jgi:Ca2+-binding RTX toxin-like protein
MALRTWIAPVDGNWSGRLNWTGQETPQNGDDVVISFPNDNITTTITTSFTLNDFTTDEDFLLSGGNLAVYGIGLLNANTTLSGGTLFGDTLTGEENFINNGNIFIVGPIATSLATGTLKNLGTITQTANFGLSNGTINNQSGGTYDFQSGVISGGSGGNDFFKNSGTLLKTTNATATINTTFNNQPGGLIDVQAGTLNINGGNSAGGDYAVASGGVLNYGSSHTFSGTHTGSGAGTINFDGGTKTFNNATFDFAPGLLQLNGTILTGNLTNTGNLSIINNSTTIGNGSVSGTINNQGTITQNTTTPLSGVGLLNGTINNQSGGTYDLQSGVIAAISGSSNGIFNNSGTLLKTTNTTVAINTNFTNSGTVESQGGTLRFGNAYTYTQTGGTTRLNGGSISHGAVFDLQGGSLSGNGTATGNVTNAGTIDPGFSAGQINLTGNYTSTNTADINIELGGTTKGSGYDFFDISGSANLNGTLNVSLINGFTPAIGQVFEVVEYGSLIGGGTNLTFSNLEIAPGLALEPTFDNDSLNLTVVESQLNDPPVVDNPIPNQNATENSPFSFQFAANAFSDPDAGDTLTYTATLANGDPLPSWLGFDTNTRTFSGTPGNNDAGTLDIKVTATDNDGASVTDTFNLVISDTNNPPVVANQIPDQNATENSPFSFQFAADAFSDSDPGDVLTYTYNDAEIPDWLSFDADTRTFSGTPGNNDSGTLNIEVTATDNDGASVTDEFTLTVADFVNPTTISITATTSTATEGGSNGLYTISRDNTEGELTLNLAVNNNSTASQADYTLNGSNLGNTFSVTLAEGQSTIALNLAAIDDTLVESNESLILDLVANSNYQIDGNNSSATATILDNDTVTAGIKRVGNNKSNKLDGGAGNDTLIGLGSNDTLNGFDGNDILDGGNGNDSLKGGNGNDTLNGGNDNDTLEGGEGNDTLNGGNGNNCLKGENGNDKLNGGASSDTLSGGEGDDILDGGIRNDTIYGENGNDLLQGNFGKDFLRGGLGNDTLNGGRGNDTFVIASGEGTDEINDFILSQGDKIGLADGLTIDDIYTSGNSIFAVVDNEELAFLKGINTNNLPDSAFVEV